VCLSRTDTCRACTLVVQDVQHLAMAIQEHGQWRLQRVFQPRRYGNAALNCDSIVSEVVINADTIRSVVAYSAIHTVADVALITKCLCDVIWELRLVEEGLSILAGPLHQIFQCVFHCKAIHCHVVAGDNEACVARIIFMLYMASNVMVGTPEPDVITNNMAGSDAQHHICLDLRLRRIIGSTYACENVMKEAGVHLIALVGAISPLKKCVSTVHASLKQDPRDSYPVDIPHSHCWVSLRCNQGGKTDSKHNLVVFHYL